MKDNRFLISAITLVVLALVGWLAFYSVSWSRIDASLRQSCIDAGGVWNGTCVWSQSLGDREAVITVEEDGSYPAGCVPGRLCDDSVVTP